MLTLEKEQKVLYDKVSLISSKKVVYLLGEWAIMAVQPYPFLIGYTFSTSNYYVGYDIEYHANDLLTILSFGRIYILLRAALLMTPYMNNRGSHSFYSSQPTLQNVRLQGRLQLRPKMFVQRPSSQTNLHFLPPKCLHLRLPSLHRLEETTPYSQ